MPYKKVPIMPPDGSIDWASLEVQAHITASGSLLRQVPVLVVGGVPITESLAIIEYINSVYPDPPLIPFNNPVAAAQCRQGALHESTTFSQFNFSHRCRCAYTVATLK